MTRSVSISKISGGQTQVVKQWMTKEWMKDNLVESQGLYATQIPYRSEEVATVITTTTARSA